MTARRAGVTLHRMNHDKRRDWGRRRAYMREYQRRWVARRRAEFLAGKCCSLCGATSDLDIDHVDPGSKVSHRVWSWRKELREAELAKCQILCSRHHQEKTNADNGFGLRHGTVSGYGYYKCRCRPCTDAAVQRVSDNRRKRRKECSGVAQQVEHASVKRAVVDSTSTP